MDEKIALKPCPFCGGNAVMIRCGLTKDWLVTCETEDCCGANEFQDEQGGASGGRNCEANAISAWNTRYEPNPWKYPSRGELPSSEGYYVCSFTGGAVGV